MIVVALIAALAVVLVVWWQVAGRIRSARTKRNLPLVRDAALALDLEWPEPSELAFAVPSLLVSVSTSDVTEDGDPCVRPVAARELDAPPICWVEVLATIDGDFPQHLTLWPRARHRIRGFEGDLGDPAFARAFARAFAAFGHPRDRARALLTPEVRRALLAVPRWSVAIQGATGRAWLRATCMVDDLDAPLTDLRAILDLAATFGLHGRGAPYRSAA